MDNQPTNQPTQPAGGDVQPQSPPPAAYSPYQPPAMPPGSPQPPSGMKTWQIVCIVVAVGVFILIATIVGVVALSGSANRKISGSNDRADGREEYSPKRKSYKNDTVSFNYHGALEEQSLESWNYNVRKGTVSDRRVYGANRMDYFVVYTQVKDDGHPANMTKLQMANEMKSLAKQVESGGSAASEALRHEQLICKDYEPENLSGLTASVDEIADGTPAVRISYSCDPELGDISKEVNTQQLTWYDHEGRLNTITVSANYVMEKRYGKDAILMPVKTARLRQLSY